MRHESTIRRGQGNWHSTSQFYCLSDDEIIHSLNTRSDVHRGCRFDATTRFAAIRIPVDSPYLDATGLCAIRTALDSIATSIKLFKYAEELYLYIFFTEPVSSCDVAAILLTRLTKAGIEVSDSTVEIHPSDRALPLPLQPGFAWLNATGQIIVHRDDISLESAISLFLFDIRKHAIEPNFFFTALTEISPSTPTYSTCTLQEQTQGKNSLPAAAVSVQIAEANSISGSDNLCHQYLRGTVVLPRLIIFAPFEKFVQSEPTDSRAPPSIIRNRVYTKCRSPDFKRFSVRETINCLASAKTRLALVLSRTRLFETLTLSHINDRNTPNALPKNLCRNKSTAGKGYQHKITQRRFIQQNT